MANIVLEKVVKELKLVKPVVTSRYWRSWWPFNEALAVTSPVTMVYDCWPSIILSAERYIQNPGKFKTGGIFRTLPHIYNEALQEKAKSYNYFCKL